MKNKKRTVALLRATFTDISRPRIGVQDGKVEIPQTLSQQSPVETILENTRLSSFDSIFSKIIIFLIFTFERPPNHEKMCLIPSLREWKRKLIP